MRGPDVTELTIERLGQRGEGIAAGPIYVAFALPGDRIEAEINADRGALKQIISPSADRVPAICGYFGTCGGCAVQTLAAPAYETWKRNLVVEALRHHKIEVVVAPLANVHGAGRRRATFHAAMENGKARVGFMQARSHDIVEIDGCPLFAPELGGAVQAAREISQALAHRNKPLDLVVSTTINGLDVDVRGCGPLGDADIQKLTKLATSLNLARLANHGTNIVERLPPLVQMGLAQVALPPGAFLQATIAADHALAQAVVSAIGTSKKIADLFSGVGTFALRLAQKAQVHAVENDAAALRALQIASHTPGLRQVTTELRDLVARPLQPAELNGFDAIVFDPPRAGAEAQCRELAKSTVVKIIAVSCNIQTFTRDARILIDAGYSLETVTPYDQFLYSTHVEVIGVFSRKIVKAKRRLFG